MAAVVFRAGCRAGLGLRAVAWAAPRAPCSSSSSRPSIAMAAAAPAAGWRRKTRRRTVHTSVSSPQESVATDPKIRTLVDDIAKLNLKEVADLTALLKSELNISDAPVQMAAAVMPAGGAAPAEEEKKEEQTEFSVKVTGLSDDKKAKVKVTMEVKGIMSQTDPSVNLGKAKAMVEKELPLTVKADIPKDEAEELKKKLEAAGAVVTIE